MIGFEDMKIISWSIRGALHENGKLFVKELVRTKNPDIILLYETCCQSARVSRFWNSLRFTLGFVYEDFGYRGGIWVLIRSNATFSYCLVHSHGQAISFELWRDNLSWVCTAVYVSPTPVLREELWEHLSLMRNTILSPWLLIGDMNEVLLPSEVRGGDFLPNRADKFAEVLTACNLVDLGLVGGKFTWFRHRNQRIILSKRLDRGLGDVDWRLAFPDASVEVLHRAHSDHCPLLLHCGGQNHRTNGPKPFRFIAAWVDHPMYQSIVQGAWQRGTNDIQAKLDQIRKDSEVFNKETFGDILRRKHWVEGRLKRGPKRSR